MKLYDHVYTPWKLDNGRLIVSPDLLRGCEKLRGLTKWSDADGAANRYRVLIDIPGGDLFARWDGPVRREDGQILTWQFDSLTWRHLPGTTFTGDTAKALTITDLRAALFRVIDACPNLRFLATTREPENVQCLRLQATQTTFARAMTMGRPSLLFLAQTSPSPSAPIARPRLTQAGKRLTGVRRCASGCCCGWKSVRNLTCSIG